MRSGELELDMGRYGFRRRRRFCCFSKRVPAGSPRPGWSSDQLNYPPMPKGCLLVISAPSGAGKTSIVHRLLARDDRLAFSVSHTTRASRPGEQEGVDYYFTDRASFLALARDGKFLEWAEVHGELYGTSREQVERGTASGRDIVLDIDLNGARQVSRSGTPATFIFVLPPSRQELARRLASRGTDPDDQIVSRLQTAREEIGGADFYDFFLVNGDLVRAVEEMRAIIVAARLRAPCMEETRERVLASFETP